MTKPDGPIDFWFSIGSTYTYLTVMRLPALAEATGVPFRWRPFDVRAILVDLKHTPFPRESPKTAYMWRDLGRRAQMHGLPFAGPVAYPLKDLALLNRIALDALPEGWGVPFVQAVYRGWFGSRQDPSTPEALAATLRGLGRDADADLRRADTPESAGRLARETDEARAAGIFGAPAFAVGGELFWGDDRLENALEWFRKGTLVPEAS
jgi:2-hydroxychromene-2-carboxylate isomerase